MQQHNRSYTYPKRLGTGCEPVNKDEINAEKKNIIKNNLEFFDYLIQYYKLRS